MFPRERRLRKTPEIVGVLRKGRRSLSAPVSLSFLSRPSQVSRLTVIVDTKVSKRATTRNLVKRRLRAILAQQTLPNGDFVARALPGSPNASFSELQRKVTECLKRLS